MRQRVLTALVLAPVVLAAVFLSSPWPVLALCTLLVVLSLDEVRRLLGHGALGFFPAVAFLGIVEDVLRGAHRERVVFYGLLFFVIGCLSALFTRDRTFSRVASGFWPAAPLGLLFALHQSALDGGVWDFRSPVLLALLPVWAGDIAAIFAGKAFGRHKLAPSISPNKTWEGSIANLLAAILVATPLGEAVGVGWLAGLLCGIGAGILGQAGDLFESHLKRRAGVKDSGTLLPGHGGVLDRIDSVLFTAPWVALVLLVFERRYR